jgi:cold shock protein
MLLPNRAIGGSAFVIGHMCGELPMATGTVEWFNPVMGTGYIKPADGGTAILVRRLAVELAGLKSLTAGQSLQYEVATGLNGRLSAVTLKVDGPTAGSKAHAPENEIIQTHAANDHARRPRRTSRHGGPASDRESLATP